MAGEVEVRIPRLRYDITMPLIEGRVEIDGVRLVVDPSAPGGTAVDADGPVAKGEFGLVDLNMGNLLPAIEAGWEVVGLPVFSKRKPVYTFMFCRADAGIDTPKDLEGRRVMSSLTGSALSIWTKGLLRHRYDVDVESITWISGGERWPVYNPRWKTEAPKARKNAFEALVDGDVDATMTDISDGALFEKLETDPRTKRLFPDYRAEDKTLYDATGIFTPVHIIAMSKKLDREYPDLGGKLYQAFEQAKEIAYQDILNDRAGFSVVYLRERLVEQMRDWGDVFKYGITANRSTIDAFAEYNDEQGSVQHRFSDEESFAASTLGT
jgi:4,5-dihydroxyphthalate decarboxylase